MLKKKTEEKTTKDQGLLDGGIPLKTLVVKEAVSFIGSGVTKATTIGTPHQRLEGIRLIPGVGVTVSHKQGTSIIPLANIAVMELLDE